MFGIRLIASAFVLYLLWGVIRGYIEGGPEAPSLTLLIVSIVLLGGGAIAVAITAYRTWKKAKAAAQMTQEEIDQVEALRAQDQAPSDSDEA